MSIKANRLCPGFYQVGDLHLIEKEGNKWKVMRFPTKNSSNPEETYYFDYYAEARDHAIMEASVIELCCTFPSTLP